MQNEQLDRKFSRVLVVTTETTQRAFQCVLEEDHYSSEYRGNSRDAFTMLETHPVDIIIIDAAAVEPPLMEILEAFQQAAPNSIRILISPPENKVAIMDALARGAIQQYISKPWDAAGLRRTLAYAVRLQRELREQQLRDILPPLSTLPSPPKFQQRLHQMLDNVDGSLNDLVAELENSPSLVAKILQVANSVHAGSLRKISKIRDGVIFIGMAYVSTLLMAVEVFQNFQKGMDRKSLALLEKLWDDAIARAVVAKKISESFPHMNNPHEAYIAALLQDIGYVVRLCSAPAKYREVFVDVAGSSFDLYVAETKAFKVPHDQVGAALLELWNFPMSVVNAVANHHAETGGDELTTILQAAGILCAKDVTMPHDVVVESLCDEWAERLGIPLRFAEPATVVESDRGVNA